MSRVTWVSGVTTIPSHWANDVNEATFGNKDYADATGAANTYAVALPVTKTAYYDGMVVEFSTTNANAGASTMNVNGLGAVSILNAGGAALAVGQIAANTITRLVYNTSGPWFEIQSGANLAQFTASLSASGYQKLPGGLILQWGTGTSTAGSLAVTFPITFPTACLNVTGAIKSTTSSILSVGVPTTSGVTISTANSTNAVANVAGVNWLAIGY